MGSILDAVLDRGKMWGEGILPEPKEANGGSALSAKGACQFSLGPSPKAIH
jgi:hypothetical protein